MGGFGSGISKMLGLVLGGGIIILVIGNIFLNFWPQVTVISGNITSMTGTDLGTSTMKWAFPLVLLVFGLVIGVALIIWAVRRIQDI